MYPDDVQIVYRHFPLNQIHNLAQKAAEASEAAGAQGAFWEYHDALYETQSEWSRLSFEDGIDFFVQLAEELELDAEQLANDLANDTYAEVVSAQEAEAIALGLPGTPSAIFNGTLLAGQSMPPAALWIWEAFVELEFLQARQYSEPPEMMIDTDKSYFATVEMESGDTFTIELFADQTPITVNSFVFLAQDGWFDDNTFHRVLPGFVAQTGDPSGTGAGAPGYFIPNEVTPDLSHDKAGMVGMANSGPDQNGSQWYITLGDVSQLDGGYTVFGQIVEGLDVVQGLTPRDPSAAPDSPAGDRIVSVTIEER